MRRVAEDELVAWAKQVPRMPLLLRGARQVGKTTLVRMFAEKHHYDLLEINFESMSKYMACFETLDAQEMVAALSFVSQRKIEENKTLLFLDEIQMCPQAILALRYFKEQMPNLHVIAAGSLLEFTLNRTEFRMPVGRVQSLYLKPLSFLEFLEATQPHDNIQYLRSLSYKDKIPTSIHEAMLSAVKEYTLIGGMPEVVKQHIEKRDYRVTERLQGNLLDAYRHDFGKYGIKINLHLLQSVYQKIPGIVGHHFKFSKLDLEQQSREIKPILQALYDAGLTYPVYATHASGLPLAVGKSERKFKLLFLDIGLLQHAQGVTSDLLLGDMAHMLNTGVLAEQFVGQELLAYQPSYEPASLFYWDRDKKGSQAEVDYVTQQGARVIPIEVKAGSTGRLKSLHVFMQEKQTSLGIHLSQQPLQHRAGVLSVPLYLCWKISQFINEIS